MSEVTLGEVAQAVRLDINFVRDILTEKPGTSVDKTTLDLVFRAARKMGYDFKKLKLGKRMNLRKDVILDLLKQIKTHPKWKRKEILAYMKKASEMIDRVDKRAFKEEFGK